MKNTSIDFYIKKFSKYNPENCNLSTIPMLVRRKLENLDKVILTSAFEIYEDGTEEIICSSAFGEIDRLNAIIESYQKFNEVSPIKFSGSVHNYPAGLICQLKGITVPYHAISAGENSLSIGLIKSFISDKSKVIFCYGESFPSPKSVACLISKSDGEIKCRFTKSACESENDEFLAFENFLLGNSRTFKTPCGIIERVE